MTIYLNLGSNKGERFENINKAVALVSCLPWIENSTLKSSRIYESKPWGYESHNIFLNVGLKFDTIGDLNPEDILEALQNIEKQIDAGRHRNEKGDYIDRAIDIDIIAIDEMIIDTPRLKVPHPYMHLREFVVNPMLELNPFWRHPILGDAWKDGFMTSNSDT